MVIGIDASRANEAQRTGTEWYSFHLINACKSIIPETDQVILYSKEPLRLDWGALPPNWSNKILNWKPGLLWTQLRLSWEMLIHKPDVLFIPAHTMPIIHPRTALVAHDLGFERAVDLYGATSIGKQTLFGRSLKWIVRAATLGRYGTTELDYHRWSMKFGIKHAYRVITISEFTKQEILQVYHPRHPEKIKVIWHGLPERKPAPSEAVTSYKATKPILLYIGRIELKKNLSVVIEALSHLPHSWRPQLVCIGKDGVGAEQIKQQVINLELDADVTFTGWLAESRVDEWRHQATAMILPSTYEGFGLPILEAWQAGIPMITSDIPALREVGGEAVEFFTVSSSQDCARAILNLLQRPEYQQQLVQKGQHRLSLFTLERMTRQTFEVIQDCAKLRS